jgi:hypothetical protein
VTSSAASIVSALALIDERFSELASDLRQRDAVSSTSVAVSPKHYADGDRVECYVDAELRSGNGVGGWLELRFVDGSWIIESSVKHNTEKGETEILGLPTRYAVDDEELMGELSGASAGLVSAVNSLDLADL